jgi:hypothetical protein
MTCCNNTTENAKRSTQGRVLFMIDRQLRGAVLLSFSLWPNLTSSKRGEISLATMWSSRTDTGPANNQTAIQYVPITWDTSLVSFKGTALRQLPSHLRIWYLHQFYIIHVLLLLSVVLTKRGKHCQAASMQRDDLFHARRCTVACHVWSWSGFFVCAYACVLIFSL